MASTSRASPSARAATAEGANPIRVAPWRVTACARARMAVVLPAPAGPTAVTTARGLVARARTMRTWSAPSGVPRLAASARTRSTTASVTGAMSSFSAVSSSCVSRLMTPGEV